MKSVCGLDVHKDSVYLCILSEFGELIEKVFGVFNLSVGRIYSTEFGDKVKTIQPTSGLQYKSIQLFLG